MKTKQTNTLMVFAMMIIFTCTLQAQHTEIEYNSSGGDPQLLLKENNTGFSRLTMQNTAPGHWTLAAINGNSSVGDDFNIYYDNGTTGFNILNIDGDLPQFNIDADVNAKENLYVGSDNNFSNLFLTPTAMYFNSDGNSSTGDLGWLRMFSTTTPQIQLKSTEDILFMTGSPTVYTKLTEEGQLSLGSGSAVNPNAKLQVVEGVLSSGQRLSRYIMNPLSNVNAKYAEWTDNSATSTPGEIMFFKQGHAIFASNVKVGAGGTNTTSILADLHVDQASQSSASSSGIRLEYDASTYWNIYTNGASGSLRFADNGTFRAYIEDGTGSFQITSDARLKENIETFENVLPKVTQLRPAYYNYKSDKSKTRTMGFLAQEVETYFPEAVGEENGYKTLAYDHFAVIAIKAIQEQQEIIEDKVNDINDLKSEMASLRAMIEEIKADK